MSESSARRPHSEPIIVIDTARFLTDHPENAGVSDAIKLARAYVSLFEQFDALRDGYLELEADQHSWSPRPCRTCRGISETLGRDFGCQRYAQIHEAQTIMLRTGDPKQYRAALAVSSPATEPKEELA